MELDLQNLSKELESIQAKLMINPSNVHLWLQEHDLLNKIHMDHLEQQIY